MHPTLSFIYTSQLLSCQNGDRIILSMADRCCTSWMYLETYILSYTCLERKRVLGSRIRIYALKKYWWYLEALAADFLGDLLKPSRNNLLWFHWTELTLDGLSHHRGFSLTLFWKPSKSSVKILQALTTPDMARSGPCVVRNLQCCYAVLPTRGRGNSHKQRRARRNELARKACFDLCRFTKQQEALSTQLYSSSNDMAPNESNFNLSQ